MELFCGIEEERLERRKDFLDFFEPVSKTQKQRRLPPSNLEIVQQTAEELNGTLGKSKTFLRLSKIKRKSFSPHINAARSAEKTDGKFLKLSFFF